MNLKKFLLIGVLLVMQFGICAVYAWGADENQVIMPDSRLQDEFNNIVSPENEGQVSSSEILKLKENTKSVEHLLQQLVYFRANARKVYFQEKTSSVQLDRATNVSYIILKEFINLDEKSKKISSASARSIINAVVPYLGTKDLELRKQLLWLLNLIDYRGILKVDYGEYESCIKDVKDNPPQALIQYMYEKLPGEALLSLMHVYMKEPKNEESIVQAESAIREDIKKREFGSVEESSKVGLDVKEALNKLSKNEQWWVRLYVAEVIGREPVLRSPEILERLKKDTSPLVHETLKRFQIE